MREIVMDTETTGLDCRGGDRLVEIGGIEVANYIPTGRTYHQYINPQREMPAEAFAVHGLSAQFLSSKPVFAEAVADFLAFAGDARLVFHNASFDIGFINMELERVSYPAVPPSRIVDTLEIARRKHPAGPNNLDALCQRYRIDNSFRALHGALLDARLLAEVYLQLSGGHQPVFDLSLVTASADPALDSGANGAVLVRPQPLPENLVEAELVAHEAFVHGLGESPLWRLYVNTAEHARGSAPSLDLAWHERVTAEELLDAGAVIFQREVPGEPSEYGSHDLHITDAGVEIFGGTHGEGTAFGDVSPLGPRESEHFSALAAAGHDQGQFHNAFNALARDLSVSVASVAEAYCGQALDRADRAACLGNIEDSFYDARRQASQDRQNGGPRRS